MYYYTRHIHVCFRVYIFNAIFLFCLLERLRSIVMSTFVCVCLSVCLSARISPETLAAIFTKFCMHVAHSRGSNILRRRCDTLRTSGFVNDTRFFL